MELTIFFCLIFYVLCDNKTGLEGVQNLIKTLLMSAKTNNLQMVNSLILEGFYIKDGRGNIKKDRSQIVHELSNLKDSLDLQTSHLKWFNSTGDLVLYTDLDYELNIKERFWVSKYIFHLESSLRGEFVKSIEVVREDIALTEKKFGFNTKKLLIRLLLGLSSLNQTDEVLQYLHEDFYFVENDKIQKNLQIVEKIAGFRRLIDMDSAWLKNWKMPKNSSVYTVEIGVFSKNREQKYIFDIESLPERLVLTSLKVEKIGMTQAEIKKYLEAKTEIVGNLLTSAKNGDLTKILSLLDDDFYVLDGNKMVHTKDASLFGAWVFKVGERIDLSSASLKFWDRTMDGRFVGDLEFGLVKFDRPMYATVVFQVEDNFEKTRIKFLQLLRNK